jgi:hypothetical protein
MATNPDTALSLAAPSGRNRADLKNRTRRSSSRVWAGASTRIIPNLAELTIQRKRRRRCMAASACTHAAPHPDWTPSSQQSFSTQMTSESRRVLPHSNALSRHRKEISNCTEAAHVPTSGAFREAPRQLVSIGTTDCGSGLFILILDHLSGSKPGPSLSTNTRPGAIGNEHDRRCRIVVKGRTSCVAVDWRDASGWSVSSRQGAYVGQQQGTEHPAVVSARRAAQHRWSSSTLCKASPFSDCSLTRTLASLFRG